MKSKNILNRRDFLGIIAGGAAMSMSRLSFAANIIQSDDKPNYLFILSDDHSYHDTGCYGNSTIRTPNMDMLSREGMRFTCAFTPASMCAPSRSALYTGLYPHRNGAHPNHSRIRIGIRTLPQYLIDLGYRVVLAGKTHIGPRGSFPFEYIGLRDVDNFLKNAGKVPFCLFIATNDPHSPFPEPPPGEEYAPDKIYIPPYLVDTKEVRQNQAAYYYAITSCDKQVGMHLESLQKYGFEENTLVIYAGDHGQGYPFAKWTLYDAGIKVPFIIRWPGRIKPGTVTDAMVSFVDVLPMFIELAGGTLPKTLDGTSFLHVLEGRNTEHHEAVFGTHTTHGIISGSHFYPSRGIRTKKYKYICNLNPEGTFINVVTHGNNYNPDEAGPMWKSWLKRAEEGDQFAIQQVHKYQHRPAEELYNIELDPFELKNIINENTEIAAELRKQLVEWMTQQNDPLLYLMSPNRTSRG